MSKCLGLIFTPLTSITVNFQLKLFSCDSVDILCKPNDMLQKKTEEHKQQKTEQKGLDQKRNCLFVFFLFCFCQKKRNFGNAPRYPEDIKWSAASVSTLNFSLSSLFWLSGFLLFWLSWFFLFLLPRALLSAFLGGLSLLSTLTTVSLVSKMLRTCFFHLKTSPTVATGASSSTWTSVRVEVGVLVFGCSKFSSLSCSSQGSVFSRHWNIMSILIKKAFIHLFSQVEWLEVVLHTHKNSRNWYIKDQN